MQPPDPSTEALPLRPSGTSPVGRGRQGGGSTYEATYRRGEMALPSLLAVLAVLGGGLYLILQDPSGDRVLVAVLWLIGAVVVAMFAILAAAFRVHRWTVEAAGIAVSERPKVPLLGLRRRTVVAFEDVRAFRWVESGFDRLLEIVAADGRRYRLSQAHKRGGEAPADLGGFAEATRAAARHAGRELPATTQGLSFWNSWVGLGLILVMFAVSVVLAAAVGWALWDGMTTTQPRGGHFAAIVMLLPVGAGWLLLKSFRRRKSVLEALRRP
jgi:hypothetical protein